MKLKLIILLLSILCSSLCFAAITTWTSSLPKSSRFVVSSEMEKRVDFWVKIYSQYSTTQGVFHLVNKPEAILGEIDLTEIFNNDSLSAHVKKDLIKKTVTNKKNLILAKYNITNPRQVRLQMGLRDRMKKAFYLSGSYLKQMEDIFKQQNLPIELTRLVYVESSFNIYAQSKVGASGLWQIMPNVAREKGYITKNSDKRNHPIYATKLAAQILKQNHNEFKSWPLAITAYNHGLTGVKRMMRKNNAVSIEDLIDSDNPTRTWGFASKNFYACFLAVLQVEKNANDLFGDDLLKAPILVYKEIKLKNNKKKSVVLTWFDGSLTRLKQMNPHLNWASITRQQVVPAGVLLMVPQKNVALLKNYNY